MLYFSDERGESHQDSWQQPEPHTPLEALAVIGWDCWTVVLNTYGCCVSSARDLCCDVVVAFVGNTKSVLLTFVLQSITVQNALGPGGCSCVMDERCRLATSAFLMVFFLPKFMYIFVSICERGRRVVYREVVPGAVLHHQWDFSTEPLGRTGGGKEGLMGWRGEEGVRRRQKEGR